MLTLKLSCVECASRFRQGLQQRITYGIERMRFLPVSSLMIRSLTISYHAICVDTHINVDFT